MVNSDDGPMDTMKINFSLLYQLSNIIYQLKATFRYFIIKPLIKANNTSASSENSLVRNL